MTNSKFSLQSRHPITTYQKMIQQQESTFHRLLSTYLHKKRLKTTAVEQQTLVSKLQTLVLKQLPNALQAAHPLRVSEQSFILELARKCLQQYRGQFNRLVDQTDRLILEQNPEKIVYRYQPLLHYAVNNFMLKGYFLSYLAEDIRASVQLSLMEKARAGRFNNQFKQEALFSTYFRRVVENAIRDELKLKKYRQEKPLTHALHYTASQHQNQTYLMDALRKLNDFLKSLPSKDRCKMELLLKIIYRIPITTNDLTKTFPDSSLSKCQHFITLLGGCSKHLSKGTIYETANQLFQILDSSSKAVKADALRVWFQNRRKLLLRWIFGKQIDIKLSAVDEYLEFLLFKYYKEIA